MELQGQNIMPGDRDKLKLPTLLWSHRAYIFDLTEHTRIDSTNTAILLSTTQREIWQNFLISSGFETMRILT